MFGLGKKKDQPEPSGAGDWQALVERFMLQPHPKGGYYRETYRSPLQVAPAGAELRYGGARAASTSILYLLPEGAQTALARLRSDEIVHFYRGGPMTFVKISPAGLVLEVVLGPDLAGGHQVQHVIEAGWWFGGYCNPGSGYSLIGCTVAPGFDFADFRMPPRAELLSRPPRNCSGL